MAEIRKIGGTLKLDSMGFFINPCNMDLVCPPWSEVVEEIKNAFLTYLGTKIHSIYVRGSVAKGTAVESVSDLDMFAIVHDDPSDIDMSWEDEFRLLMSRKYPFVNGIEMGIAPIDKASGDSSVRALCFLIKTQSLCVWGRDLIPVLENFAPGRYLTDGIHDFEDNVRMITSNISGIEDKNQLDSICMWIMKQAVRTGFLLVAEQEQTFTRDLYPCYQLFCRHYPEYKAEMKFALQAAIGPQCSREELLCFLNEFGMQLTNMVNVSYPRQQETAGCLVKDC